MLIGTVAFGLFLSIVMAMAGWTLNKEARSRGMGFGTGFFCSACVVLTVVLAIIIYQIFHPAHGSDFLRMANWYFWELLSLGLASITVSIIGFLGKAKTRARSKNCERTRLFAWFQVVVAPIITPASLRFGLGRCWDDRFRGAWEAVTVTPPPSASQLKRMTTAPAAMMRAEARRHLVRRSFRTTTEITRTKMIEVSRRAATAATGARVMAQSART